jgi:polar amino acid transport system substrate-binding protein
MQDRQKIYKKLQKVIGVAVAAACLATVGATSHQALAQSSASVTVAPAPTFQDPHFRSEKPAGDPGTIRFLTSGDFPPFNFLDSKGGLIGYNVDLARAICDVLGATCTLQMRPFSDLIPALADKRGDAVIAGVKAMPDLAAKVDFTGPYLTTPGRFVARKGSRLVPTPEGLQGRWISVVSGSAHEAYVLDLFPGSRVVAYPTDLAARDALRDGTVDVNFSDSIASSFWLLRKASRNCCMYLGGPYLEGAYFGDGLRVAFMRGNRKLKRQLDFALNRLTENGTLRELYLRYFPLGYY